MNGEQVLGCVSRPMLDPRREQDGDFATYIQALCYGSALTSLPRIVFTPNTVHG